jgi:hypothetical protein
MKIWKKILIAIVILFGVLFVGMVVWSMSSSYPADPAVEPYLQSSDLVEVEDGRWLTFKPVDTEPAVGFIFYPGGNVDHLAYVPALYRIAEAGYLVVDVPMPMDLAVISPDKAQKVIDAYPEIKTWVIGGHSLGGAMSARFVYENPGLIHGLVFWAAYPADSNSLVDVEIPILSLYGTQDGVATIGKIERRFELLPDDTTYTPIEGGNHAQFGYYGPQNRDLEASISREEQQDQIVEKMIAFLGQFE